MSSPDTTAQDDRITPRTLLPPPAVFNTSLPDELSYLITAFLPSHPPATRSKAFLTLSAFCQGTRNSFPVKGELPDPATVALVKIFQPLIIPCVRDPEESIVITGVSFLTALFQIDWESASSIFQLDGVLETVMDGVDLAPSAQLVQSVVYLLAQACGHKTCRAFLTTQSVKWLDLMSQVSEDLNIRAGATNALIKLLKGSTNDNAESGVADTVTGKEKVLANAMKEILVSGGDITSISDAVEGLAYLSTEPDLKDILSRDTVLLRRLFSLIPHHPSHPPGDSSERTSTVVFGVLVIISNLCTYRPLLTEEQTQIEKLRQMTKNESEQLSKISSFDDNESVKARIRRLLDVGVLNVFPAAIRVESPGIRTSIGKSLRSIVEDKENRGKVLQNGGAKILGQIINKQAPITASNPSDRTSQIDSVYIDSIQALAKLAITSSPVQVFGPDAGAMYDAIRPFSFMLQLPSSTLLQQFESMMALTNLSSHNAEIAARIAQAPNLMNKIELLLLEEHILVRRAAMELLCNLIAGSDDVFERYAGETNISNTKSKLQVILALCDVEDQPTRLAASGALATLSTAPAACRVLTSLPMDRRRAFLNIARLIDPSVVRRESGEDSEEEIEDHHPGFIHRGVVCAQNMFVNIKEQTLRKKLIKEAEDTGLTQALVNIVKSQTGNTNEHTLLPAAPSKKAGKKATSKKPAAGGQGKVAKADWKEGFKKKQVGVSDMTLLTTISNESINENLQKRWTNAEIYTYIGAVLISVNPFRDLGIYTEETLQKYRGKNRLEVPPHVFSIAESAYYNMNAYHENQCVIISGESGAGKTEAAKRIMQYIAEVSGGQDSSIQEIKDMVLATNPLLESFGCAKTLRNNNSSRHGKYLEIMFNTQGEPVGAQITNYLLEKGRVVGQIENERDFHIFYQFTKGASDEQREMFGLQGPEAYAYTSLSNCLDVSDIDDVKDYHDTIKAMGVIGLSQEEQTEIFRMLAIILWLGNVQFEEMEDGNSRIADTDVTDFVAYLMEADSALVQKVLTSKIMETTRGGRRGSVYDVPLNPAQASSGRDALAKAIYNNLFEWIVSRINVSMKPRAASAHIIGILDIFGFEIFDDNSFEQLCINYVNEKLQQIFIELTLKTEQEEYVREEIKWTPIKYFNNKIVCDLIEERRPPGIFAALNDACATAHADPSAADSSFIQRTSMLSSNPHFEARGSQFLVKHYAGDVMYNVAGMTDKNKDSLIKDLLDLIAGSGNQFLQTLFPDRPDPNSKKRPPTAGDRIKSSASALVDNLMKARPSYIRTIKPNQNRSSSEYDVKAILHQIKYLGLQENIRVRRAGFAYRNTFEKMVERFYLLSPKTSYAGEYIWHGDAKSGCEQMLKDTGIAKDEWQMGVTKAFIKNPETLFALETMRDRYWHNMAARIQRAFRNYMRYKHECARRIQRFWKNNKEGLAYAQVREYGHQILAGRKERRRFSLLSYRRFMGDYLDVNGKSALGEELARACGIGESATFSGRIQLLVSKLGRSSKPSPRFLVVTHKAVHIIVTTSKEGHAIYTLERKIPLVTIKSIGMSNLRDDWMTLNGAVTEEGDPIFSCYFKTELATHLLQLTQASIVLLIGPTAEYAKKKDKKAQIKFIKDESVTKNDIYKSHTVSVASGEPPNSVSRPPAKRKPGIVRPITSGKLLRAGGPSDKPKTIPKPKPAARPLPGQSTPAIVPDIMAKSAPSGSGGRSPPPAPPRNVVPAPPPALPEVPRYRAKFAFEGQEGEMSLQKDDVVELVEKDDNGWWLVKKGGNEGWAPNNYLEIVPPKTAPVHAPPPPPARPRPTSVAAPKPLLSSVSADASAKPVSVFPGMGSSDGSTAPWKKGSVSTNSAPSSRPSSSLGSKPPGPPVAAKPKPPPVAAKPGAPKPPGKPPIPSAPRPNAGAAPMGRPVPTKPVTAVGHMDLSAALAKRAQRIADNE
ncbi:microfilament motor [Collybia nuda]|uniref:Microfilament motor n=1 Tax=Collybia nuda TaxID=64659 RepID=A0A9P5YH68_9AGAR|nr:microfilament motor [Collybia nuda]